MVRLGKVHIQLCRVWSGTVWRGMVRFGMAWFIFNMRGQVRYGKVWLVWAWLGKVHISLHSEVRLGSVRYGMAR